MPEKPAQVTILIPLPVFYNPDGHGVREPVEEEKFLITAEEITQRFGGTKMIKGEI